MKRWLTVALVLCLTACANVPVESIRLNQIVNSNLADLHKKHTSLVHEYFNLKVEQFDEWYLRVYEPAFRQNYEKVWKAKFPNDPFDFKKEDHRRRYMQDAIAEHEELVAKVKAPEQEFIKALDDAYADTAKANEAVTNLLKSAGSLSEAEKKAWNDNAGKLFPQLDSANIDRRIRSIQDSAMGLLT
jgi:hypothetical protein